MAEHCWLLLLELPKYFGRQYHAAKRRLSYFASVCRSNLLHFTVILLLTISFVVTAWFSQLTFVIGNSASFNGRASLRLPFSSGIAVLRFLQAVTSTLTTGALAQTLEILQWTLALKSKRNRTRRLQLLTALSIAPSTGILGLFKYLYKCSPKKLRREWAVLR